MRVVGAANKRIDCVLRGLNLHWWNNRGIEVIACDLMRIVECSVLSGGVGLVNGLYYGIAVDDDCTRVWVRDCFVGPDDGEVARAPVPLEGRGIGVHATRAYVLGNDARVPTNAVTKHGIRLGTASQYITVDNNQTNGQGLTVAGGPHSIGPSNRDDV